MLLASCSPVYKGNIDYAMSGGILWPGEPEKPRIKYLWNITIKKDNTQRLPVKKYDKLYIENSSSNSPLIYGEFNNDLVRINGTLNINNAFSQINLILNTVGRIKL